MSERPLIIFTNDDGIDSPGLWAAVKAFEGYADLMVCAPREQQSGMGRSLPRFSAGIIYERHEMTTIENCVAYAVDGTPAQSVQHAVLELVDRKPALAVSGINYGDNTGNGVTISGTVGAAIEAASLDIPAIAVSQQTPFDMHLTHSTDIDFTAAAYFTHLFGMWLIDHEARPDDVDFLKVEIPLAATPQTEWAVTRLSRRRVYYPTRPERESLASHGKLGYRFDADPANAEPDSDVYNMMHKGRVTVTPMSLDLTSRTDLYRLSQLLENKRQYGVAGGDEFKNVI